MDDGNCGPRHTQSSARCTAAIERAELCTEMARARLLAEFGDEFRVEDPTNHSTAHDLLLGQCHENAHACATELDPFFDDVAIVIGTINYPDKPEPETFESARDVVLNAFSLHVWVEVLSEASPTGYIVCEPVSEADDHWGEMLVGTARPDGYRVPENGDRFKFESWMTRDHIAGETLFDEFESRATRLPTE